MKKNAIVFVTAFLFLVGCSSTTVIKSIPPASKIYLDGQFKGETPCTHSDAAILMSKKTVLLKKEGYKDFTSEIKKDDARVGSIIAGIFLLVPLAWALGYQDEYIFEMEKL